MAGGYMGRFSFMNLSTGEIREEAPEERLYRDFIGGYGIGGRILYGRQKGVDPLGPENTLGPITGPLTGTPAIVGTRYVAVAKSPIIGGWGDTNSGGDFGPYLKIAGYDAVFFNGKAELRDAGHLLGKDTCETEEILITEHGKETRVSCIGPSGERLTLISCIITKKGAAACRSGLGTVTGSKKLKAVAVKGNMAVPIADKAKADQLRKEHISYLQKTQPGTPSFLEKFRKYGTSEIADCYSCRRLSR